MDLIGCYPNLIKVVADALKLSGLYLKWVHTDMQAKTHLSS